jgi:hypothetical protein
MTSASKYAVFVLLVLATTGCTSLFKKKANPVPQQAQAPPITTGQTSTPLPTLEPEAPSPTPLPDTTNEQPVTPVPTHKKRPAVVHKPKPSPAKPGETTVAGTTPPSTDPKSPAAGTAPAAAPPTQTASTGTAPESSVIGTLSTGDVATGSQTRRETTDLINTTETGLNSIKRPLNGQEQETVGQIKTFLQKARQALQVDDVDGAKTLATKAKVLLEELTKQ